MKKIFHKILAVLMSFVVLFSTMSFTIDMHYCGDILVDSSLLSSAESCGMDSPQSKSQKETITEKSCCHNQQITLKGQDELNMSFDTLTFHQQQFIVSFAYSYIYLFEGFGKKEIPFSNYTAPLVVRDIQKLDEVYLI